MNYHNGAAHAATRLFSDTLSGREAAPASEQAEFTGNCSELFKDAYAGLLNDRPRTQLSFDNLFTLSMEFPPEDIFSETVSARQYI